MMKWILAFTTLLSTSASAYWNPITIHNYAPYGIIYRFTLEELPNALYIIYKDGTDIFHSGVGNKRSWFGVQACTLNDEKGKCILYTRHFLPNPYNAEKIATINIKAVDDVEVICHDGTSTSCMLQ